MSQTANVLKLAMELLPGGWCAERDERCRRLDLVREADLSALDVEYEASIASMPADDSLGEAILLAYRREGIVAEQSGGPKPLGGPG